MTQITIGDNFVEVSGHAPKAVVCHGVSAISQMVANYVECNDWGKIRRDDGYLCIYDIQEIYCSSPLFKAMIAGLKDIAAEYPKTIEFRYV